ncbi:PiggyBac transposable element-derived protein 4-like [Plakobranchus ocellatus]|uniref:PiggyBac transposable element-derived protein 4-like n=1 Tax=Plakobranchus ocellatus TaxID=259542 RepID=A0AAV4A696_9GAST|nr:PiggyBac transposable element-derived protein 4-like [Plakobranchus ocellatus]
MLSAEIASRKSPATFILQTATTTSLAVSRDTTLYKPRQGNSYTSDEGEAETYTYSELQCQVLYKSMPRLQGSKPMDHFAFHLNIARSLARGKTARRQAPEAGPSVSGLVNRDQVRHRRVRLPGRKKQCFECRLRDVKTETNRHPETAFGCPTCNVHLCDELCFQQFHNITSN